MAAVLEVSKTALAWLMNIELVTFWILIFALVFGRLILFALPVFIAIEAVLYPMGSWFFMYLYIWPLIAIAGLILREKASRLSYTVASGLFGFGFGALGTFVNIPLMGVPASISWWIAGIPTDITHGISNIVFMFVLFNPIRKTLKRFNP